MGRCGNALMIAFRVLQLILSIVALACAAYIVYSMLSLGDTAHDLENVLGLFVNATDPSSTSDSDLDSLHNGLKDAQKILNPILNYFQEMPSRAITLTVVSVWSLFVIVYLLVAQSRAAKNPSMNRRRLRVTLELLTLIFWLAGIACALLLAVQYGPLGLLGGSEAKVFTTVIRKAAEKQVAKDATPDSKTLGESIGFVDDLLTVGILSILASGAAIVCGAVSLVSCIAACCIKGRPLPKQISKTNNTSFYNLERNQPYDQTQPLTLPEKDVVYAVNQVSTPNSWHSSPKPAVYYNQGYHAVSSYDAPMPYHPRDGRPGY